MRDQKLFQHYYFNFWKEKARDVLLEKAYLLDSIIESPANLYNVCEGVAFGDEFTQNNHGGLIGFKQPVAFLYHTGASRCEDRIIVKSTLDGDDLFEVFISGKNFMHHLAHVSSKIVREEKRDGMTWYLHRCDLSLVPGQKYSIFTPKIFV
jgi:hypothetical protein